VTITETAGKLLDKLADRLARRQGKKLSGYQELVARMADGKAADVEDAERVLAEVGKSVEELRADVARLLARRQARDAVERAKSVPAERDRIHHQALAADAALTAAVEAAKAKHEGAVGPLRQRLVALDQIERDAQAGRRLLEETAAPSPELAAELEKLRDALAEARRRESEANAAATRLERAAAEVGRKVHEVGISRPQHLKPQWSAQAAALEAEAAPYRAASERGVAEVADLERQIDALNERMLLE
jgi:hypothetical protein